MALAQTSVVRHFGGLNDPRRERRRLHNLCDMIAIALCAVICGAGSSGGCGGVWTTKKGLAHDVPSPPQWDSLARHVQPLVPPAEAAAVSSVFRPLDAGIGRGDRGPHRGH